MKSVFPGQNYYRNSFTTIIVSVARRNVVLVANNSPQSPSVGQPVTWNVYAQDMVSNTPITAYFHILLRFRPVCHGPPS
ncbi:hypothetical protein E6H17_05360 [Candidatus Bathyarchaeota archaeon]|nr:MAG: hypothetical protein E6H17_05360 [Candidatus Bathyarchaeota archaeon]